MLALAYARMERRLVTGGEDVRGAKRKISEGTFTECRRSSPELPYVTLLLLTLPPLLLVAGGDGNVCECRLSAEGAIEKMYVRSTPVSRVTRVDLQVRVCEERKAKSCE